MERSSLYRFVWRWHFYAGVIVMPLVMLLAITGSIFLFNPQIERWEERAFHGLPTAGAVAPTVQRDAALAAYPGASFKSYRLPDRPGDAAMIELASKGTGKGGAKEQVFVSPQGKVLGAIKPEERIMPYIQKIHGQLLLGKPGSWIVELAASWAIVMLVTGLYLWWPAGRGLAGVVYPRLGGPGRAFWRDIHAVTGFWVSAFALVLLWTGLPWADVWGSSFKTVRQELGWVKGKQDWTIGGVPADVGGEHEGHEGHGDMAGMAGMPGMGSMSAKDHMTMIELAGGPEAFVSLDQIVAKVAPQHLAFPVIINPPTLQGMTWKVRSDAQNRPLRINLTYSAMDGKETSRDDFAHKHPVDQVMGYGIAWHEGQLFGWVNQAVGVLTAISLVMLVVSSFMMWQKRRPKGALGAPPKSRAKMTSWGVRIGFVFFFVTLPLFAISSTVLFLFDLLVLPRLPGLARWLGMQAPAEA
jgi:uncharacterized iron-regulated membrane protein